MKHRLIIVAEYGAVVIGSVMAIAVGSVFLLGALLFVATGIIWMPIVAVAQLYEYRRNPMAETIVGRLFRKFEQAKASGPK